MLENKVSSNLETDSDIWKWANKVHFGLTLKDQFLDWDRKNPGYKIGEVINMNDPLEQSRHFLHCVSGDFKTEPDPFGSVFKFNFTSKQPYNFVHLHHFGAICISFGDRGYIVFVKDGQFLKNSCKLDYEELIQTEKIEMHDMLFFFAKIIEYYERLVVSIPVMIMPGKIVKIGSAKIRKHKPINKELLSKLCEWMGFTWIDESIA